jgi:hypothetical protein
MKLQECLEPPTTPYLLHPNIFPSILYLNTLTIGPMFFCLRVYLFTISTHVPNCPLKFCPPLHYWKRTNFIHQCRNIRLNGQLPWSCDCRPVTPEQARRNVLESSHTAFSVGSHSGNCEAYNLSLPPAFCRFLVWLPLRPCKWMRYIPPNRRWASIELHGVTTQKEALQIQSSCFVVYLSISVR